MQLVNIKIIEADLKCLTGTHIGANDTEIHIGGVDSPVIRDPSTLKPYIPGSTLKGKMRSLLEWRSGAVKDDAPFSWNLYNKIIKDEGKNSKKAAEVLKILTLFGTSADKEDNSALGPTRASFWDCSMDDSWCNDMAENNVPLTEAKTENSIDRITAVANPRTQERVSAGAVFKFKLSLRCLDSDSSELLDVIFKGMKLLELDGIGGSVSRGYGKVAFEKVKVDGKDHQEQYSTIKPFD